MHTWKNIYIYISPEKEEAKLWLPTKKVIIFLDKYKTKTTKYLELMRTH